ncbi:terminal repeat-encoded protein [Staphylococcus virus vB_SurM-PSU6]|nr:terminal repeat-encoded protein [Staphylococcus virus vB_SurM-PSU6]
MTNLLEQEQLEKDVKDIIWVLDRMISRGEQYTEAYDILVNKLERQEKRIIEIKKQNGIF